MEHKVFDPSGEYDHAPTSDKDMKTLLMNVFTTHETQIQSRCTLI